jgi:hypothetical protein
MPAVPPRSSPTRALALLVPVLLASCTMVGPDFERPEVPWLDGWSADALQSAEAESQEVGRPPVQLDEWWRNFHDPVLEKLVEEAQRLNPGVRTAGMRILEARAQLGIAGSGLYPQLQQLNGASLFVGTEQSQGRDRNFWTGNVGLNVGWELDFWGKFRRGIESADAGYFEHRTVRRCRSRRGAGRELLPTIRTVELRLRIAHENAAQKRSLEITERLFLSGNESAAGAHALPEHARDIPGSRSARQAEKRARDLLARPPGPLPEMEGGRERAPEATSGSSPKPRRPATAPARRARLSFEWPRSRHRSE